MLHAGRSRGFGGACPCELDTAAGYLGMEILWRRKSWHCWNGCSIGESGTAVIAVQNLYRVRNIAGWILFFKRCGQSVGECPRWGLRRTGGGRSGWRSGQFSDRRATFLRVVVEASADPRRAERADGLAVGGARGLGPSERYLIAFANGAQVGRRLR